MKTPKPKLADLARLLTARALAQDFMAMCPPASDFDYWKSLAIPPRRHHGTQPKMVQRPYR
jgi:hypothetical protein